MVVCLKEEEDLLRAAELGKLDRDKIEKLNKEKADVLAKEALDASDKRTVLNDAKMNANRLAKEAGVVIDEEVGGGEGSGIGEVDVVDFEELMLHLMFFGGWV